MSSRRSRSGGSCDREHGEPVVEILAEAAVVDLAAQIAVRRGDDAHVDRDARRRRRRRRTSPRLEHAQELGLQVERQLADLVEEQRAAVGLLERAGAPRDRAGERAALVAEELALERALAGSRRS